MSYNSASGQDVYALAAAEAMDNLPHVTRQATGIAIVQESLPNGLTYDAAMLGVRELALFEAARASFMSVDTVTIGTEARDILTAQTAWGRGTQQYFIGKDGIDHLCFTRTVTGGRVIMVEYSARGYATSHNPEAIDRRTGFLKNFDGVVYHTIQHRLLASGGTCFDHIEPANAYERGVWNLGKACQMGGWKQVRPQLVQIVKAMADSTFKAQVDGVHILELLGHMGQRKLTPMAWFVEVQPNYQELPLAQQKPLSAAFLDPRRTLDAWTSMLSRHATLVTENKLGVYMTLG